MYSKVYSIVHTGVDHTGSNVSGKMATESNILSFSVEILRQICSYLSYGTLCNLVLVSRRLREVGEDPWLWRKFPFKFTNVQKLQQFLKINRFSALESLKIRRGFFTNFQDYPSETKY